MLVNDRVSNSPPLITTVGEVIELTQGNGGGFAEQSAGYRNSNASCQPNQIEIPRRGAE